MNKYAICQNCGSGLNAFGVCPVCTEQGNHIDPCVPQEPIENYTEIEVDL